MGRSPQYRKAGRDRAGRGKWWRGGGRVKWLRFCRAPSEGAGDIIGSGDSSRPYRAASTSVIAKSAPLNSSLAFKRFGQGVGEAIAHVELRGMLHALAVARGGFERALGGCRLDRDELDIGGGEEIRDVDFRLGD